MIKKHIVVLGLALLSFLLLFGCSSTLSDSQETGSLIVGKSDGRALDVNTIKQAKVTITGNDSNGGKITPITENVPGVSGGVGSFVITGIPLGKNRIVTVEGFGNDGKAIAGAVLRAVVNINAGSNTIDKISWITSRKGYVYNALFESGVNVSEVDESTDGHIPECAPASINLTAFVKDYKDNSLKSKDNYIIIASAAELSYVKVSGDLPNLKATAYYTDGTDKDVTSSGVWTTSNKDCATVDKGVVSYVDAGKTTVYVSYTDAGKTVKSNAAEVTVASEGGEINKLYLVPSPDWAGANAWFAAYFFGGSNPKKWVKMEKSGDKYVCDKPSGYSTVIFCRMNPAYTALDWPSKWNQTGDLSIPSDKDTFANNATAWDNATEKWLDTLSGTYSGGGLKGAVDFETIIVPAKPTVTISPASGSISLTGSVKVTFTDGNDTITSAKVSINGTPYDMGTTAGTFTKSVKDLGITAGGTTITVSATVTNGEGSGTANATLTTTDTPVVEDTFTWDNVNCYFVLTDRFYNGDTKNDHSYYRQNKDNNAKLASGYNDVATFHGGDIAGLTQKLDYLDKLGVNAIWITAPYEQAHGWCSGGGKGFPHYAFHGYYTLDWTYMDQNMGTIEEFRTFVDEAHKRGIRIVMDVVMNHTGYNTVEDMLTYDFGNFNTMPAHGWIGNGTWTDNHSITNYDEQGKWGNWWGCWVRAFSDHPSWASNAGYAPGGSGEITGSLSGLPDVVTERTTPVAIPTFLKTKWAAETDSKTVPSETGNTLGKKYGDYKLNSISNVDWNGKSGDWRSDNKGAPTDYQVMWLSGWVREFGIDGFRCDTAKHIDMYRWGELKKACQSALEAWRKDSSKKDTAGAKDWDENFWMTGECFGWTATNGQGDYYTTGGFDSMIGFGIGGGNDWQNSGYSYHNPVISESTWSSYLNINKNVDSDSNGNRNNVLTYISSHDTRLSRTNDQSSLGTMFVLLPGGVQIYYGDETSREKAYTDCGDGDMATRGDFNWDAADGATARHWGKVGTFRKFNPAVGAGTGSATKRSYSGPAGESKVAIGVGGTSVDVSGLFSDGTTVYNWYDGKSATVSGGKVTSFAGGTTSQPILISDKNPADFGLSF